MNTYVPYDSNATSEFMLERRGKTFFLLKSSHIFPVLNKEFTSIPMLASPTHSSYSMNVLVAGSHLYAPQPATCFKDSVGSQQ